MAQRCPTLVRGHRHIVFAPSVPPALAERWLASWEDAFGPDRRPAPGMPTKEDLAVDDCELGTVVLKRARARGLRGLGIRGTRAARAFALGRAMVERGVPTPEPLAVVRERSARAEVRTCLVTRFVDGVGPWEVFARGPEDAARLVDAIAAAIASLHSAGFRHRDLKAPNLLVEENVPTTLGVRILDLDGGFRCAPAPRRMTTLRDLARLGASFGSPAALDAGVGPEHWEELIGRYLEARHGGPPDVRELRRMIAETTRRARRKIARNRRVGRPLA